MNGVKTGTILGLIHNLEELKNYFSDMTPIRKNALVSM